MENRAEPSGSFDERNALEELERLRGQIERFRSQRKAVEEEFDQFIRSFKTPDESTQPRAARDEPARRPAPQAASSVVAPAPRVSPPGAPAAAEPGARVASSIGEPPRVAPPIPQPAAEPGAPVTATSAQPTVQAPPRIAPPGVPPAGEPPPPVTPAVMAPVTVQPPPVTSKPPATADATALPQFLPEPKAKPVPGAVAPARSASGSKLLLAAALILIVGGGLVAWLMRGGSGEPAPASTPTVVAAPPSAPAPVPEVAAPAVPAPSPNEAELTTIRNVWMRVLVDGERVVEREVPAGTRVPLTAQKTISIRTGDAGAVRLSIGGQDQGFLGREGAVVTRTFAVPVAPPR